jgi:hypothetical protein
MEQIVRGARRSSQVLLLGLVVTFALVTIVVSPVLFGDLNATDRDWAYLSAVGQAYGGVSAILSGLALCGITASLVLQRQQALSDRMAATSQRHFDILRLALDDPALAQVLAPERASSAYVREQIFANLIMTFWYRSWRQRIINEYELRTSVARMFMSSVSREWWARVRPFWLEGTSTRIERKFTAVVQSEWVKAHLASTNEESRSDQTGFSATELGTPG